MKYSDTKGNKVTPADSYCKSYLYKRVSQKTFIKWHLNS